MLPVKEDVKIGSARPPKVPDDMTLVQARRQGYHYRYAGENHIRVFDKNGSFDETLRVLLVPNFVKKCWDICVEFRRGGKKKSISLGIIKETDLNKLGITTPRELDLAKIKSWKI